MKKGTNVVLIIFITLVFLNLLAWAAVFRLAKPQYLEVIFFDVGQGDAALIETPQKNQILIDGGPDSIVLEKLGKEMPFWDRTIDLMILTHPEQDHMRGLIEVLKRYKVENILWTGVVRNTGEYAEWINLLEAENGKVYFAKSGQWVACVRCGNRKWAMRILFPFESVAGQRLNSSNNSSVVAKLIYGQTEFLFTGDIEKSAEHQLVDSNLDLTAEVLKVAHHGSKTSSSEEFLEAIVPRVAVVSAGRNNRYGHPHPQVLENLNKHNIEVLRTDDRGDIKIVSDGINFSVR